MTQSSPFDAQAHRNGDDQAYGYDLVVIGSSAGGIEALSTLVRGLPADFGAALVIAQHLDPDHISHLGEILARHTVLEVRTVVDQEPLIPGVIYVVPADRDVEITDHTVGLRPHGNSRSTPSVNRLFTSAAHAHGEHLIAVILTGAGSDGASGARDVKSAGGTVIIENPATAAYASMPQSLAPTTVDLVVELAQIGPLLGDLVAGEYVPSSIEADTALPMLLEQVRDRTGIDFSVYKPPTILRRLQRRMAMTHMETLTAYLQFISDHPEEYRLLTSSFLIKVTEFFHDPELFAILRDDILPGLIAQARAKGEQVRVWSAGCATGEEAYSLAILLADLLGNDLEQVQVRIFATDVDPDAIAFARRGLYPPAALTTLSADMVARSFTLVEDGYEIIPAIRNLVIFGQHDLGLRAPFPHIDLVLCRNVLIYFTAELQRRALQLFAFAVRDGGYLALGKAESPSPFAAYFAPISASLKLYRRQGARVLVPPARLTNQPLFISPLPNVRRSAAMLPMPSSPASGIATTNEYVGALLVQSQVGVVVVDRHYDIQTINRAAQQMLGIYRSATGEDLIHLVAPELAQPLRGVIDAALASQGPPAEGIITLTVVKPRALQITAMSTTGTVLLQITDITARMQAQQATDAALHKSEEMAAAGTPAERRASPSQKQRAWETERQQLQAEIARLAEQVRLMTTTNHALHVANDDVARINQTVSGLNEDLVVRNEELQSSSEEIKTLNEELQATNEELETLNEEMEATVEKLRATNEDLMARTKEVQHLAALREAQRQASAAKAAELTTILLSMGDALLVVDQVGEIQFTNAAYLTLFGDARLDWVAEDEAGHPLPPAATPQQRMLAGLPFRMVFTQPLAEGGRRWLEATGEPIRMSGALTGSVLTLRDITDRSLRRLQDEFIALASHELRSPLTALRMATQMMGRLLQPDNERMPVLMDIMLRQCQRLDQLINDLMDISRLQHGKLHLTLAPIDLRAVVKDAVATFSLAEPQLPVVVEAGDGNPLTILGDEVRVEQILTNLLNNACKYAARSPEIVVRLRQVGDSAEIQVQDDGPGIDAAVLPQLFQRFYQTSPNAKAARTGLGLGLFITHELVEALGGDIQVSSQVGQGTNFTVRFPLLSAP